jgi:eukaryotic-like serine/threonine-protein kinase
VFPSGKHIDFLSGDAVEGVTLANRPGRGNLPVEEGLRYAIEIARILSSAHSRGLVHGGLSPASIALTKEGARVVRPPLLDGRLSEYRSPEQVRGEAPDSLTDIFAFGVLLYEMMAGRRAFGGTGEELDQAILESTPAWSGVGFSVPAALQELIASLMVKDPTHRRQRIQNALVELKLIATGLPHLQPVRSPSNNAQAPRATRPTSGFWHRRFSAAAIVLIALAGSAVAAALLLERRPSSQVFKFTIGVPEQTEYIGSPTVSPDGRQVAFSAIGAEGKGMLWLRSLDALHAVPIPGTEGGAEPFWSPDGQSIAFFANASLKQVQAVGGTPLTICSAQEPAGGGSWNRDGVIVFAPGLTTGLYRVPAGGGTPQPLLGLDSRRRERSFLWPTFLPDGRHVLYFDLTETADTTGVYVGSLDGTEPRMLLRSNANAVYAGSGSADASGSLLFIKEGGVAAQAFDPLRLILKGEPVTVANDVGSLESLHRIPVSASNDGVLAYQVAGKQTRQLIWVDRKGARLGVVAVPGDFGVPRLSPSGTRVAAERLGHGDSREIWVQSEAKATQLTGPISGRRNSPVWSPDGSLIMFSDDRDGTSSLYSIDARMTRAMASPIFENAFAKYPTDWSRNGYYVLFTSVRPAGHPEIWALSVVGRQARPIVNTGHNDQNAAFSPDGKWIAYQSDESGTDEIYVQPFEGLWGGAAGRQRVSTGGGALPRWSRNGGGLYYVTSDGSLMSVAVGGAARNRLFGAPRALFRTRQVANTRNSFDVSPDGQRFIMNLPLEDSTASPITIITNWSDNALR